MFKFPSLGVSKTIVGPLTLTVINAYHFWSKTFLIKPVTTIYSLQKPAYQNCE